MIIYLGESTLYKRILYILLYGRVAFIEIYFWQMFYWENIRRSSYYGLNFLKLSSLTLSCLFPVSWYEWRVSQYVALFKYWIYYDLHGWGYVEVDCIKKGIKISSLFIFYEIGVFFFITSILNQTLGFFRIIFVMAGTCLILLLLSSHFQEWS